ncbi:hypothetical protein [Alteriqipengyuania sp.]|uniref:hypothetical protein n=1 Tax=Alteriqipengyuania sp. TaxID=2800692 RepID=UPI003516EB16
MLRKLNIATIAVATALFAPAAAAAQDTTCRTGLFTQGEGFRQAQITAKRAFFYKDADGCPQASGCRSNSYVIDGDNLVVGRRIGDFVCAFYPSTQGGTAGWINIGALHIRPLDARPPLARWLGAWSDGMSADVDILSKDGRTYIVGEAFWPARPEENEWISIHIGEVNDRLAIAGHRATYADENLCELELTLLPDFLLIADNRKCGGANVSFSGVYTRAR